ncbi:hypothetical protein SLEP1_g27172 [Rubroshorea leprosula]|uniref:Uncharacterized protein n=1 Tax=Rubroshorea leprosula TaxID=152421 RepID=A0AAV5JSD5_9ROSI|nr:hypothetical protein SLEP1_g27172 [Rubroshorea leprosula]
MASSEETRIQIHANNMQQDHEEQSSSYAMQLVNSVTLPMTLHAALQLDIFQIIAKAGPDAKLSPQEIATQLGARNPDAAMMLDRILRLLATYNVLTCSVAVNDHQDDPQRLYGLACVSKYFIRNEDGVSLGPLMALLQDKVFLNSWSQLKDAIVEGGVPFHRVHGTHAFEYPAKDSRFNQVFNKAMINHTTIVIKEILESYNGFEHLTRLVDVGGGLGVTLSFITSKYLSINGINFDLPHVVQHAPPYAGVEHVGGDMFHSVPKGDAIFMKWILHDWSDDHCVKLLKNCYDAIPDNGKVIVVDAIAPVLPEQNVASRAIAEMDMLMMTQSPGGKERTQQEFIKLATRAGFSGIKYKCFVFNSWVMEFFK